MYSMEGAKQLISDFKVCVHVCVQECVCLLFRHTPSFICVFDLFIVSDLLIFLADKHGLNHSVSMGGHFSVT